MNFGGEDYRFWLAVIGASLFKLATSPYHSFVRAVVTVLAAVFSAWLFTDPLIHFLALDAASYRNPMAAVLALIGEGAMRWLIGLNPDKAIALWKDLRR